MSKLNHTPGPWAIERNDKNHPVIMSADDETICLPIVSLPMIGHIESNASLIAAAPDMLDALIESYKFYREAIVDYGPCDHAVNICICPIIRQTEKIQEIIESATGLPIEEVLK
jgi:hypothetical protein